MTGIIIQQLFFLLGGLTVFMIGMSMMGSNLEQVAGSGLRKLMSKASANRFVGVGTGTLITAIVNSSSATTIMIVGFVNIGLLSLTQATPIIMGANIGTTLSAFIMALSGGDGFSVAAVFAFLAFVGLALRMFAKSDKMHCIGNIFVGIGFIFVGLNVMSGAVNELIADEQVGPVFQQLFTSLAGDDPQGALSIGTIFLLFFLGMALTAVLQASSAITGIMITLASAGLVSVNMAMFVVLGTNIGTCCTSLISSIGTDTNGKRTAVIHLLFNVIGSILFMIPLIIFQNQMVACLNFFTQEVKWEIAIFHMIFNVVTTLLLLPFVKPLAKLATLLVPESKKAQKKKAATLLDERLIKSPPIAVAQIRSEIDNMGSLAFANYVSAVEMLLTGNFEGKATFAANERTINELNREIAAFCVKLTNQELTSRDEKKISSFYRVISDLERIGDYAENIVEYAEKMAAEQVVFSETAREEIRAVDDLIKQLYFKIEYAFRERDLSASAEIDAIEDQIDALTNRMGDMHIRRMTNGECTPEAGAIYLQLSGNLERIADHMVNVSNSVKTYTQVGE